MRAATLATNVEIQRAAYPGSSTVGGSRSRFAASFFASLSSATATFHALFDALVGCFSLRVKETPILCKEKNLVISKKVRFNRVRYSHSLF